MHPNAAGDQKVADRWFAALTAVLDGTSPDDPTPPASEGPTTPGSGCSAEYAVANQWQGGFQGQVTVTNTGATTTAGWQVEFTFADGQQISQSWQADVTQTGATVRATSAEWNGRLAAGREHRVRVHRDVGRRQRAARGALYRGLSLNRFNAMLACSAAAGTRLRRRSYGGLR